MPAKVSSDNREPTLKKTWTITAAQDDFVRRKVRELQRHVSGKDAKEVTESAYIQALLKFAMESDTGEIAHKVQDRIKVGHGDDGSAGSS